MSDRDGDAKASPSCHADADADANAHALALPVQRAFTFADAGVLMYRKGTGYKLAVTSYEFKLIEDGC